MILPTGSRHRRGFTLIELLVVMGIIATLAAISVGSIMRTPSQSGLMGAEGLLASSIRSARHSALSTGAPVEIRLREDPTTGRWTLQGIGELVLWSDAFEQRGSSDPLRNTPYGFTGGGLDLDVDEVVFREIPARPRLFVDADDSFSLICHVRPPLRRPTGASGGHAYPIAVGVVGGDVLMAINLVEMQEFDNVPVAQRRDEPLLYLPEALLNGVSIGPTDPDNPIIGGEWVNLQLMYSAGTLRLLRDGREIGSASATTPSLTTADGLEIIFGASQGIPARIDEVRLTKLGVNQPVPLPDSVTVASGETTITVLPDGSVQSGSGSIELLLRAQSADSQHDRSTVTINSNGQVSSNLTVVQPEDEEEDEEEP